MLAMFLNFFCSETCFLVLPSYFFFELQLTALILGLLLLFVLFSQTYFHNLKNFHFAPFKEKEKML